MRRRFVRLMIERLEDRLAPAFVTIQAGTQGITVEDTQISAVAPSTPAPTSPVITVAGANAAGGASQSLIRFNNLFGTGASQIPLNATIVSASLTLWAVGTGSQMTSVQIRPVYVPWNDASATWQAFGNGIQLDGVESSSTPTVTTQMTSTGWNLSGRAIVNDVQFWQLGNAALGWVITASLPGGSWSFASSEDPTLAHRPTLTVEYATLPNNSNPSYTDLVGAPPEVSKLAWFDWEEDLRDARISRTPQNRTSTYYFSTSGSDVTGWGTIDHPWKTIAKAQQVLDKVAGDVRLRFRRGDVWHEYTALSIARDGVTLDDYGDASLPKPVISRFLPINSASWEWVQGNLYKFTSPPGIGWLREAADGYSKIYYRAASSAEVAGRSISWYYDANGLDPLSEDQPTLYANFGGNLSNVPGGLEYCPDDGFGWETSGDNVRLENLRLEGQGVSASGESYGLKINQRGRWEFVGVGLEVYYTGYHAIGQIVQYADGHGAATLFNCSAGLCVNRFGTGSPGSGDVTVFVSYGDYGGNEYIQDHCTMAFGALPSADWAAVPGQALGQGLYTHTGVANTYLDLVIAIGTTVNPAVNPLAIRNHVDCAMPASSLGEVRAYIVEDVPSQVESHWHSPDVAIVNCVIDRTSVLASTLNGYAFYRAPFLVGSWLLNCTLKIDVQLVPAWFDAFSLIRSGTDTSHYINCHFDFFNAVCPLFVRSPFDDTDASGMWITNSIISFQGTSTTGIGPVGHLQNNAYFMPGITSLPGWDYSQDLGSVELLNRYPVGVSPTPLSPLYDSGLDVGLEYDQNRKPRGTLKGIGPLVGVSLPAPSDVTYSWGTRTAHLAPGSILAQSTIKRITLVFPQPVDVGGDCLVIKDEVGPLPIFSFTNNYAAKSATWTLALPLKQGHYEIEVNGQPLTSFNVLPGDFNGDGIVELMDFSVLRGVFGTTSPLCDIDGNGRTDLADFARFRSFYGIVI